MKKYQSFLSEIFQFLEAKFSIYLNKRVCRPFFPRERTKGLTEFSMTCDYLFKHV